MPERTCQGCDTPIIPGPRERRKRKWCSESCRVRTHRARTLPPRGPRPCEVCGVIIPFTRRASAKYCSEACGAEAVSRRRIARSLIPQQFTCKKCGSDFERLPVKGTPPSWCTDCRTLIKDASGRSRGMFRITCAFCGIEAEVTNCSAKCCSFRCAQRLRVGHSLGTAIVHVPPPPKPRRVHPSELPPPKRTDWWSFFISGPCRRCGDIFTAPSAGGTPPAYCSTRCARADSKDRRRARKRDAFVAPVFRRKIFDRDSWRCQLCGKAVNRKAVVPHPKAPVLDHIIPLAAGGTHEPSNAQCAHYLCNSVKSDGAMNDQLRLIG